MQGGRSFSFKAAPSSLEVWARAARSCAPEWGGVLIESSSASQDHWPVSFSSNVRVVAKRHYANTPRAVFLPVTTSFTSSYRRLQQPARQSICSRSETRVASLPFTWRWTRVSAQVLNVSATASTRHSCAVPLRATVL